MLDMAARGRAGGGIRAGNVASRIDLTIQLPLDVVISQDTDLASVLLYPSFFRPVITTLLFAILLSCTVNVQ